MLFFPLINLKMPTIVGILSFMSGKNFVLSWVEHEKSFITLGPGISSKKISFSHRQWHDRAVKLQETQDVSYIGKNKCLWTTDERTTKANSYCSYARSAQSDPIRLLCPFRSGPVTVLPVWWPMKNREKLNWQITRCFLKTDYNLDWLTSIHHNWPIGQSIWPN